jgi:hypothetical protein
LATEDFDDWVEVNIGATLAVEEFDNWFQVPYPGPFTLLAQETN